MKLTSFLKTTSQMLLVLFNPEPPARLGLPSPKRADRTRSRFKREFVCSELREQPGPRL